MGAIESSSRSVRQPKRQQRVRWYGRRTLKKLFSNGLRKPLPFRILDRTSTVFHGASASRYTLAYLRWQPTCRQLGIGTFGPAPHVGRPSPPDDPASPHRGRWPARGSAGGGGHLPNVAPPTPTRLLIPFPPTVIALRDGDPNNDRQPLQIECKSGPRPPLNAASSPNTPSGENGTINQTQLERSAQATAACSGPSAPIAPDGSGATSERHCPLNRKPPASPSSVPWPSRPEAAPCPAKSSRKEASA